MTVNVTVCVLTTDPRVAVIVSVLCPTATCFLVSIVSTEAPAPFTDEGLNLAPANLGKPLDRQRDVARSRLTANRHVIGGVAGPRDGGVRRRDGEDREVGADH